MRFQPCLLAAASAALLLGSSPLDVAAQPSPLPATRTSLPNVRAGTRVRVWTDDVAQLRVLSAKPEFHEGTLLWIAGDSLTFELDEPVATIGNVGLGHMRTENTVHLNRILKLERRRIGTTRGRVALGAGLGLLAGAAVASAGSQCGNDPSNLKPCSVGGRVAGGLAVASVVGTLVAIRRVWEEVPLPGR